MLRLSEEEAVIIVFPMSLDQRLNRMRELAEINTLKHNAKAALDELCVIMKGIQFVRNNVIHAIVAEDDKDGHVFHLRSKMRSLTKAEVFSVEELTNYAGHVVLALRYALGFKDDHGHNYTTPDRPEIPTFLQSVIQFPKSKAV